MATLLLADDDPALLEVLALALEGGEHVIETASDGEAALARIRQGGVDLLVSDVNMPRLDGFSLCKRLREAGERLPIVLLTSRDGEIDEALGLELGADDYVSKPFSTRVLALRIGALLRRDGKRSAGERGADETAPPLVSGALVMDLERLSVRYGGVELVMTVSELRVLEALARRPGRVLSREQLLEIVRDDGSVVGGRIVDTYVARIRRKIGAVDPSAQPIETVVGAGYRWREV